MNDKLIRRDTPLTAGMKITLLVSMSYPLAVDEWLDGRPSVTVAEIEDDLCNRHGRFRGMSRAIREEGLDGDFLEYVIAPLDADYDIRFESEWEAKERGRHEYVELAEVTSA